MSLFDGEDRPAVRAGRAAEVESYRLEVQLLQAKVRRLEQALADVLDASDAAIIDLRRQESNLLSQLERSRSEFEIAWTSFDAETAVADQLGSLDPDSRARRWLLAPKPGS